MFGLAYGNITHCAALGKHLFTPSFTKIPSEAQYHP